MSADKELELLQTPLFESHNTSTLGKSEEKSEPLKPRGVSKAERQVIKLQFQLAEAKRLAEIGVRDEDLGPLTKPKRIPSEKQLENLKKGQQIREQNRQKRKEERLQQEEEEKKEMEELIIKKAITAKKRQIQKKKVIESVVPEVEPTPAVKVRDADAQDYKIDLSSVPLQKPQIVPPVPVGPPKPKIIFY